MKKQVKVVGALIKNKDNKILICQRSANKSRGLLWEFVGGKVEDFESNEEALIRECEEELNIKVKPLDLFSHIKYSYADMIVDLNIYNTLIKSGNPELKEHNDLKWVNISELDDYKFCPADIETIKKLKISG